MYVFCSGGGRDATCSPSERKYRSEDEAIRAPECIYKRSHGKGGLKTKAMLTLMPMPAWFGVGNVESDGIFHTAGVRLLCDITLVQAVGMSEGGSAGFLFARSVLFPVSLLATRFKCDYVGIAFFRAFSLCFFLLGEP